MKIIINLICMNSAPELPALLASLKGQIDGIVAVDGGSKDDTVKVLTRWGRRNKTPVHCKVNPWPDDFALQRNICLNMTRGEYGIYSEKNNLAVLMIDSDDTLAEFDRAYIEKAMKDSTLTGLLCRMDNGNGWFNCCQFFRPTAEAVWKGAIHEHIEVRGAKGLPPVGTITIKRGRSAQHDRDPERNIRIGRRIVELEPENSRARFYLARDTMECEVLPLQQKRAEAEGHLRTYLSMKTDYPAQDRFARLLLVRLLCDGGRDAEARRMLLDSIADDPDNKSAYDALARLQGEKCADLWRRFAAVAEGQCVLPYGSKLPKSRTATGSTGSVG